MALYLREQETLNQEHSRECFETITDISYFSIFRFLEISDAGFDFSKIKKPLHN